MARYSAEALGQVVRDLRTDQGMTQETIGREAGYRTGAGVSISRLESGLLRPSPERFTGVARALGVTSDELEARASRLTAANGAASSAGVPDAAATPRGSVGLKDRVKRVQLEIDERTRVITELSEAFNEQHDRARDEFFRRFVEVAARVEGAPQPDPTRLQDDDATDANAVAAYRLKSNSTGVVQLLAGGAGGAAAGAAVGSAAAYGTFVAVASFGTASTGAVISGLSGVAATNATLSILGGGTLSAGGAGVAGGTMVLAGIVAAPAVILAAGGLLWMRKRNRKQQQELSAKLDKAEAELAATKPGVEALKNILPRAAEALDYIATHAGHALNRWETQLGPGTLSWDLLGPAEQQRYQEFVDIAAAQLTIVTINVQGLLTTRGSDQAQLAKLADELLIQSEAVVKAHV